MMSLISSPSIAQTMKWDSLNLTMPTTAAQVQVGITQPGTVIAKRVYTIDLSTVSCPAISEFPGNCLPSTHQAKTWQCWNRAAGNAVSNIAGVNLSGDAFGYWNMRLHMAEMLQKQTLYNDTEGGDTYSFLYVLDSIGAWPASVFTSIPSLRNNGDFRPCHDSIMELFRKDFESDKTIVKATLDTAIMMLDKGYGTPPSNFIVDGVNYTPKTFAQAKGIDGNIVVPVVSRLKYPYWDWVGYDPTVGLDDQGKGINLPAELLVPLMEYACKNGKGFVYGGDSHESYIVKAGKNLTIVPEWYCNWQKLNSKEQAMFREMGFTDGSTTANHAYHVFSTLKKGGRTWFLARDSGLGAWVVPETQGYWIHDGTFLALKAYTLDIPKETIIEFFAQQWVQKKYPGAKLLCQQLKTANVVSRLK